MGDSSTVGVGDRSAEGAPDRWRGWSRLLHAALATTYDVSYCNLAVTGATAYDVRRTQLRDAVAHRPDLVSLIVGINDTMRSSWDPARVREDLHACADELAASGSMLLTARFHDFPATLGVPGPLQGPLRKRLAVVNDTYAEIHARHGGVQVDLAAVCGAPRRDFFSVDRLHPSELGHRTLAAAFAEALAVAGLDVEAPSLVCDGPEAGRWEEMRWLVTEVAPWFGRRARDLGPWVARAIVTEARTRRSADLRQLPPEPDHVGVTGAVDPVETVPEVEVEVGRGAGDRGIGVGDVDVDQRAI
ncbi:MAG: family lipase [Marmoricola sp.]|nr:family lipase [Marmoricola sp.]